MKKKIAGRQTSHAKVYVKVTSDFDRTGFMIPKAVILTNGRTCPIETVTDFRPAKSFIGKENPQADCYTVIAGGKSGYLFFEHLVPENNSSPGRWFIWADSNDPAGSFWPPGGS